MNEEWHTSGEKDCVVFATITIVPSPKHRAQVLEILRSVQDLTRPTAGCRGCYLSEEDALHQPIHYLEQWDSEQALHAHLSSELYRRVLEALELSKRAPEVRFFYTAKEQGLELIEAVRRAKLQRAFYGTQETKV